VIYNYPVRFYLVGFSFWAVTMLSIFQLCHSIAGYRPKGPPPPPMMATTGAPVAHRGWDSDGWCLSDREANQHSLPGERGCWWLLMSDWWVKLKAVDFRTMGYHFLNYLYKKQINKVINWTAQDTTILSIIGNKWVPNLFCFPSFDGFHFISAII
jgi:hypothetical protein